MRGLTPKRHRKGTDFRSDVQVLPPGSTQERELDWLGFSILADVSHDGRVILFTELPEGGAEGGDTYLRKSDGSPPTRFSASVAGQPARAYVQDIDGGERRVFGPPGLTSPSVSPDGLMVAAVLQGRPVLLPTDGGNPDRARERCLRIGRFAGAPMGARSSWSAGADWSPRSPAWILRRDAACTCGTWAPGTPQARPRPMSACRLMESRTPTRYFRSLGDLYLVDGLK